MRPVALFDMRELLYPCALDKRSQTMMRDGCWYHKGKWWEYPFAFNNIPEKFDSILDIGTGRSILPYMLRYQHPDARIATLDTTYHGHTFPDNVVNEMYQNKIEHAHLQPDYDVVTCLSTIEHIDDVISFIKQLDKLQPDRLIITTDFYRDRKAQVDTGLKLADGSTRYVDWTLYDWETLNELCSELEYWTGMTIVEPKAKTVVDLFGDEIDWPIIENIMMEYHGRPYTAVGLVME